ncbi:hypothetical protein GT360_15450 [Vibrio astriarenae]|uniref:Uncharacterized protein n=1 Tax=Vibrio astriarenae TaxID=1481923 RepID=A0A7Z2T5U5_9VIBR|nr:hypothetical protein [Vibrio astriarenae]QIA64959.1 hypothetical protein GT360_15450 [Vibrio astriarenae]
MRLFLGLLFAIAFNASACFDERFHQLGGPSGALPDGVELNIPVVVEGDNGQIEFTVDIDSPTDIEELAFKLLPNPRVDLGEEEDLLIVGKKSHLVKGQVTPGTRGAVRVLVTGRIGDKDFLTSRFVMVM